MKFQTELLSGAGNTFHITYLDKEDFKSAEYSNEQMRKVAKYICEKNKADGFIFLESKDNALKEKSTRFRWNFFNNDGSDAEMCGNATRCVGYFLSNIIKNEFKTWSLETVKGEITINQISKNIFKIIMPRIVKLNSNLGFYCDTGVPHLVLEITNTDLFCNLNEDFKKASASLRNHSEFAPKGTNVTYVQFKKEEATLKAVSFERGVEDFTAACGTGAMAAAYYNLTMRGRTETEVEMPGGTLMMNLKNLDRPTMTGPADKIESFEYEIEF